ncbi:MAG TPA: DNA glycosylase, partial [archaeon]|nr:DNA glycosylase [archaeon]
MMYKITCNLFNLHYTLNCGQVFRWEYNSKNKSWTGIVGSEVINARQEENVVTIDSTLSRKVIENYFRLDDDLNKIYEQINKDQYIDAAINQYPGLRLIRQDPYECLFSYICATRANIPQIKKMVKNLSKTFGEKIKKDFHTFPTPKSLSEADKMQLKACGVGFRAPYLVETAKKIVNANYDLDSLKKLDYEKAKSELKNFKGVGEKVADCALLFSLNKLEAFPTDVWIKRIMKNYYNIEK